LHLVVVVDRANDERGRAAETARSQSLQYRAEELRSQRHLASTSRHSRVEHDDVAGSAVCPSVCLSHAGLVVKRMATLRRCI